MTMKDKNYYLNILERSFNSELLRGMQPYIDCSRIDYLVSDLFGFDIYDSEQAEIIGKKLFETIEAITERKTFEYIGESEENYTWFLMFCNSKLIYNKINWGTSVRNASWCRGGLDGYHLVTCHLLDDDGVQETDWWFTEDEWKEFMRACVEYSKKGD